MATYNKATDSPGRFQWESSAGSAEYSQKYNCGPSCVAKIAQYYTDRWNGIEANRTIIAGMGPFLVNGQVVYGAPRGMPTTAWQQAAMLRKRGVACAVYAINTSQQLANLVAGGRRPVLLGLNFARVPYGVAGHNFRGWHAITVLDVTYVGSQRFFVINDPNFSIPGGYRPDPTRGKRLYSWAVMAYALQDAATNWAVVPVSPKPAPAIKPPTITKAQEMAFAENIKSVVGRDFNVNKGVTLRKGPGSTYPFHFKTTKVETFWLHGFYPNGWAYASRDNDSQGFFWVPPDH